MHREEHAVNRNEAHPEVNLAERFVHEPAEHLRKPEVQASVGGKQRCNSHHEMEMGDDKVGVLQLNVSRGRSKEEAAQAAADKQRNESDREQRCRSELNSRAPD